jgi:ATP-binding cassette subfamily C (CFTR/MRP) protein 1
MTRYSLQCNRTADNQFGPIVPCVDFDFSLAFEQSIFIIGISSLFLVLFPFRIKQLYGTSIKTLSSPLQYLKIVSTKYLTLL